MSLATVAAPVVLMSAEDRAATEAYLSELEAEFGANASEMWAAKGAGNEVEYLRTVDKNRDLYREISEVEVALRAGVLPF